MWKILKKPFNLVPQSLLISNENEKEIKFKIYPNENISNFSFLN